MTPRPDMQTVPDGQPAQSAPAALARSGAIGGAAGSAAFLLVHQLTIVDIWFSAIPVLLAGTLCGTLLGWSYGRLARRPSTLGWIGYNAAYLAMFGGLTIASLIAFEPVATVPELMTLNGPPDRLFGQALPVTLACVPIGALAITLAFGRLRDLPAVLLTVVVLILLLGLNVSVIGLVEFRASDAILLVEFLGLIGLLAVVFAATVLLLERNGALGSDVGAIRPPPLQGEGS